MLDLYNGEEFVIKNKFLKELDAALQAIAVLLTTSSPFETAETSLYVFRGRNVTDELRPEVAIKIDKVRELITKDYAVIRHIALDSIEEDSNSSDGLIVSVSVVTSAGSTILEVPI